MASPLVQRYDKARESCALFHMEDWAAFHLAGTDVRDYLHRISTADVKALTPGVASQTLFLQGDGRLVADSIVYCAGETSWYLLSPALCRSALEAQLDKFIFTEDVQVEDLSNEYYIGMFLGQKSNLLLEHILSECLPENTNGFAAITTLAPSARRGLVVIPHAVFSQVKSCIYTWLEVNGGVIGDLDLYNTFRIEAGCPMFGSDLTEKTIPLEAGLKPAVSFTKGCFPGQEIVARINNLGHPANVLVGLTLPETTDTLDGRPLEHDGKVIGRITSICYSPLLRCPLGLGYVKWAYKEPGSSVSIGEPGSYTANVVELPVPGGEK